MDNSLSIEENKCIDLEQQVAHTTKQGTQEPCAICLGDVVDPFPLSCTHTYCKNCILCAVAENIRNKRPIVCPKSCEIAVSEETLAQLLTPELKQVHETFQLQMKVDKNPDCHWCPKLNCEKYVVIKDYKAGVRAKAECECGYQFCTACHEPWHKDKT